MQRIRVLRVTLDTNIFVRSMLTPTGINAKIVELWKQNRYILVLSTEIIEEIVEVLLRPEFIRKYPYTREDVNHLIQLIERRADIISPAISFRFCRDKSDDKFIDCAVIGRVQYLVSADNDIIDDQRLRQTLYEYGITILDAFSFFHEISNNTYS